MALWNKKKPKTQNEDAQSEDAKKLVAQIQKMFNDAYDNKSAEHKVWRECWGAYNGTYFKQNLPNYKAQELSNYIFATVETIIPIMLSNNPKMLAMPRRQEDFPKAEAIQQALDYEWQRTKMFMETIKLVRTAAIMGTAIIGLFWDGKSEGIGNVKPMLLSPFNVFVDPMATSVEDAEYIGYAAYKNVGEIIKQYPDKRELLLNATGGIDNQDLLFGKNTDNIDSKKSILYIEVYFRDYSTEIEEIEKDGTKIKEIKQKYPKGRRTIIAGDVLLYDSKNPYEDGEFPFKVYKWYDIPGKFWGIGEVEQIISPQKYQNTIMNSIIESAELMSNPVWLVDKNSGVEKGSLTNRKGLVIRKNPGTEVKREAPPPLPAYIQDIIGVLKQDIEHISGVYDVTRGERPTGITAAAAIQALNEQAQGRIKLKVKMLEDVLGDLGSLWLKRIQQFWVTKRDVRIIGADYSVSFNSVDKDQVDGDFDIIVVAGSTMPTNKAARQQVMIQLAQTMGEDGLPMVDRKALLENSDIPNVTEIIQRFEQLKQQQQEAAAQNAHEGPKVSISLPFEHIPIEGKSQILSMIGVQVSPEQCANDLLFKHDIEADTQNRQIEGQIALQNNQNALQSQLEGQAEESVNGTPMEQPMDEETARQMVIQQLAQMEPEEVYELSKQNPQIAQLLQEIQTPNTPEMGLGEEDLSV